MSNRAIVFNSGVPTAPDVKRLEDKYGIPAVGWAASWEELAAVVSSPVKSSRFRTVVLTWRRKLHRDNNVLLGAVRGEGLEVLDGHGRASFSGFKFKGGIRSIGKAAHVASSTDTTGLTDADIMTLNHVVTTSAAIRLAAATSAKALPRI